MFNNATSPLTLQWSQERNPANNLAGSSTGGQTASAAPTQGATTQPAPIDTGALVDPNVLAAQAAAAKSAQLRSQITALANSVKDIFNSRYGQVDAAAAEQAGKLNDRYANESSDITGQIESENQKLGAAHAAAGTYDSSYRGNNVDTVTHAGQNQIRDLGTGLADDLSKVGGFAASTKAGFDANKTGIDQILSHLAEETDAGNLSQIRASLEQRQADLNAGSADNNTGAQNRAALEAIAPSGARAQQLKTTLSQVVAGTADPATKANIAQRLIDSANLAPAEAQKLQLAFQSDLQNSTTQQPTA